MVYVELRFPIAGAASAREQNRGMFNAISRIIPEMRGANWITIDSSPDLNRSRSVSRICRTRNLRVRIPQSRVSLMLKLSGKRIAVGRYQVRIGTPEISLLKPSSSLYAKCVAINGCLTPDEFLDALAWKLDEMGILCEIELGLRHRFRAGGRIVTGYAVTLHELSEESSITLQEQGLGNHRHSGCGYFVPAQKYLHKRAPERRLY